MLVATDWFAGDPGERLMLRAATEVDHGGNRRRTQGLAPRLIWPFHSRPSSDRKRKPIAFDKEQICPFH